MSDTWDDGYEESLEHGHDFAEDHLSLPGPEPEGGSGLTWESSHPETLEKGMVQARYEGTCVVCKESIRIGEPITGKGVSGWRHAGCKGDQKFETRYKAEEKLSNEYLDEKGE